MSTTNFNKPAYGGGASMWAPQRAMSLPSSSSLKRNSSPGSFGSFNTSSESHLSRLWWSILVPRTRDATSPPESLRAVAQTRHETLTDWRPLYTFLDQSSIQFTNSSPVNQLRRDNTLDRILHVANEDVEMVVSGPFFSSLHLYPSSTPPRASEHLYTILYISFPKTKWAEVIPSLKLLWTWTPNLVCSDLHSFRHYTFKYNHLLHHSIFIPLSHRIHDVRTDITSLLPYPPMTSSSSLYLPRSRATFHHLTTSPLTSWHHHGIGRRCTHSGIYRSGYQFPTRSTWRTQAVHEGSRRSFW